MADTHVDLSGSGSATPPYDTWAKAASDFQTGLTAAGAGGACYLKRGGSDESSAGEISLVSPGILTNPTKLIGVKDATTNEGSSIGLADLVVRGVDTLPKFASSLVDADLSLTGSLAVHGIDFELTSGAQARVEGSVDILAHQCRFSFGGLFDIAGQFENCEIEFLSGLANFIVRGSGPKIFKGGVITFSTGANLISSSSIHDAYFTGVDLSSGPSGMNLQQAHSTVTCRAVFRNCRMPSSYQLFSGTPLKHSDSVSVEVISSNDQTSEPSSGTIQAYEYEDVFGTIDLETAHVRTNGADDGGDGGFAYAMQARADSTREGSKAALKSPVLSVWVSGGTSTDLTIFISNSSAGTDYNEDEVYVEWFIPSATGLSQHDLAFTPELERFVSSSAAITDDTVSDWNGEGAGSNNAQKLELTVTPGYTGWVYARVCLAKRQAVPDTLYVDPKIDVDGGSGTTKLV